MSSSALTAPKLCRSPSARSIDGGRELAQFVGFDQIPAVPQVEHVHQRFHAHVGRCHDDRQGWPRLPNALQQCDAIGVGQPHVEDEDVRVEIFQLAHGGGAIAPNLPHETPVSNSKRSSSLVSTSRNRSSSFAPRRHTVWRRSAALRWISIKAPSPALSTERVPDRSITRRPAPSASWSSTSPEARRNAVRDSRSSRSGAAIVFSIGRVDISVCSTGNCDIIPPVVVYATPMPCDLSRAASSGCPKLVSLLTHRPCRIPNGAVQLARVLLFLNIPRHDD